MKYPLIAKTTKYGQVHQVLEFTGVGSSDQPFGVVTDAVTGRVLSRRDYKRFEQRVVDTHYKLAEQKTEGKKKIVYDRNGDLVDSHVLSESEEDFAAHANQRGYEVVFIITEKRLDDSFSSDAPSAAAGRRGRYLKLKYWDTPVLAPSL